MLVIAHRGANKESFENSWTAFEKAIEGGATRIELDVQVTKDRELAIIHDPDLRHTVNKNEIVANLTREEISRFRLPNGDSIPFLDEVMAKLLPQVELNIEVKPRDPAVAERVMQLLAMHADQQERIIISSFEPDPLLYLAKHYPQVKLACLWDGQIRFNQCFFAAPLNFMQECRAKILHPAIKRVNENLMDQAKARGWLVFPYAGMKEEDQHREEIWSFLMTMGVDGLCTNYPRELSLWLKEYA